jgi:transcriptional regulator with XRE-family HTH domain
MKEKNIVGNRVKQARRKASPAITQLDLLARLQVLGMKVEQPAISKIESGLRPVSDYEVVALAKALNVSTSWLLGEDK